MNRVLWSIATFALTLAVAACGAMTSRLQVSLRPHASPPGLFSSTVGGAELVYRPRSPRVRFDHRRAAHEPLPCADCHHRVPTDAPGDFLVVEESSCAPCHRSEMRDLEHSDVGSVGDEGRSCLPCHEGSGPSTASLPVRGAARLSFSHDLHARRGAQCADCHRVETDPTGLSGAADLGIDLPSMRRCMTCHSEDLSVAAPRCTRCHSSLPDGRMRVRFEEGLLRPPPWLLGMDHGADWNTRHRWVAADSGTLCATCHQESECVDCHDGRVRPSLVHAGDYLSVHPAEARRNSPDCASCHSLGRFCGECHSRLGLAPHSAPDVRSLTQAHPPLWVGGPNLHAIEAERSLSACVSCHTESDCVACHGEAGVGAGFSPHPAGFARGCARLLNQQPRACRTCHRSLDELAMRCR